MKYQVNRSCPLTGRQSSNIIGYVKAQSVWTSNSTYREETSKILGIEEDDQFPIVESQPGFAYAGWLPPPEFLTKVYEDAIDHTKSATQQIGYRLDLVHFAGAILRLASEALKQPDQQLKLLDFGCGYGALLRILGCRNIETTGFEPSLERRTEASKFADRVHSELSAVTASGPYDLVICTEVLEHVSHPAETIKTLRSLTVTGGLLCLTVPLCHAGYVSDCLRRSESGESLPKVINPWEHLNYFSAESLRLLVSNGGFEVISDFGRIKPHFLSSMRMGDRDRSSTLIQNSLRAVKHIYRSKDTTEIVCRAI